jgi:Eukaryotic cytochrome b561
MSTQKETVDDFRNGGDIEGADEASYRTYWKVHGLLMAISFGVLVPIAIGSSLLRHVLKLTNKGLWFQIHRFVMGVAALCVVCGFAVAVVAINKDGDEAEHFEEGHSSIGLVIFVLVLVQALTGILRPHLPPPQHGPGSDDHATDQDVVEKATSTDGDQDPAPADRPSSSTGDDPVLNKSAQRVAFEIGHRLLAVILIALAWYNVASGISIYEEDFDIQDSHSAQTFWIVAGGLTGIIAVAYLYQSAMPVPKLSKDKDALI